MNRPIERPVFVEGQILRAADLEAEAAHGRGQLARHERYLHLWGIAHGLHLIAADKKNIDGIPYQEITLEAGMAIDGTGREIVVPEAALLSEESFDLSNVVIEDKDAWYPVFLVGLQVSAPSPAQTAFACGGTEPGRIIEKYDIRFGRPGDERQTEDEPHISDGPGDAASGSPWPVLLGFVQWNNVITKFTKFSLDANGIGPRYAGASADVVAARNGKLTLRTHTRNEAGKPALILSGQGGALLEFGVLTSAGKVTPLAVVDAKGDLTIAGKLTGAVTPGSVQVQSGIAMDGTLLPLPPGITQQQVADGKAILHTFVSPHMSGSPPPAGPGTWVAVPLKCSVDGKTCRVQCILRWFRIGGGAGDVVDRAGLCDYMVVASVPAAEGGGP